MCSDCSPVAQTYTRDAGTEVVAEILETELAGQGIRPHVISCHLHRCKVDWSILSTGHKICTCSCQFGDWL